MHAPATQPATSSTAANDTNEQNDGTNVFVVGLHTLTTNKDLTEICQKYGKVESCDVIADPHTGVSRGFAFVRMGTKEEASQLIAALNGSKIDNVPIRARLSRRGGSRPPTPGTHVGRSHGSYDGAHGGGPPPYPPYYRDPYYSRPPYRPVDPYRDPYYRDHPYYRGPPPPPLDPRGYDRDPYYRDMYYDRRYLDDPYRPYPPPPPRPYDYPPPPPRRGDPYAAAPSTAGSSSSAPQSGTSYPSPTSSSRPPAGYPPPEFRGGPGSSTPASTYDAQSYSYPSW